MKSKREKVRDLLQANVNEWVLMPRLAEVGGYRFGARIDELRNEGLSIPNMKKYKKIRGEMKVLSFYKLIEE